MSNGVPDISGELGSVIVYIVFLIICYVFYKIGISVKELWFIALIPVYLICIWQYFELVNQFDNYLLHNKILYIEFGHASLELLVLMLFCFLNAFVMIGVVFYERKSKDIN